MQDTHGMMLVILVMLNLLNTYICTTSWEDIIVAVFNLHMNQVGNDCWCAVNID